MIGDASLIRDIRCQEQVTIFVDVDSAVASAIHTMLRQNGLDSDEMEEKRLRIYEQHRRTRRCDEIP